MVTLADWLSAGIPELEFSRRPCLCRCAEERGGGCEEGEVKIYHSGLAAMRAEIYVPSQLKFPACISSQVSSDAR